MTSMQPPDDAEQRLVRLLALKRHEVPPPGFFDQLPLRILVNLRAGTEIEDAPWWVRAWRNLIHEPMIGLSYAALGVGAVLFGISVLETAIDVQSPPLGSTQGLFPTPAPDLVLADPQGANPGLIYRVVDSTPATWLQSGPTPSTPSVTTTPFARFDGLELVPVSATGQR